ncbi:fumarylacetoacetate hydrolase family protein [Streptomyces sp. T028]|uniref:fumarylacetoacetate hydrolase family protein n=1 Tax=Streptomyces sp. T028 TaxID=3394379 RepID=UPI003A864247
MRLVTYTAFGGPPLPGAELPDGAVLSLPAILGDRTPPTVARLMGADRALFEEIDAALDAAAADPAAAVAAGRLVPAGSARLLAPLGERVLMVCAGANYRSHLAEMGEEPAEELAWFVKNPNSVIGTGEPIRLPARFQDKVDFEGELCVVFGSTCHAVSAEDALSYVGGYTLMNDVSARDALDGLAAARTPADGRYAWMNMLLGKQFPTFSPLGPAVVTADEIGDPGDLDLTTTVNDTVMQNANTSDLLVGIPELIERLSRYYTFEPGDVLSTGTPAGVGAGHTPPVYLAPGDVVAVQVKGLGALINPVEAASTRKGTR